jgi:hypothetical protein
MHDRQFRELATRLLNAGVSPRRVRRLVSELRDHFEDLRKELSATGLSSQEVDAEAFAILGTGAMVEDALARSELRSWLRRWPWIGFTVAPIAMFALLFVSTLAALVFSLDFAVNSLGLDFAGRAGLRSFAQAVPGIAVWVIPIAAAWVCCALALSRRAPAIWAVVGALLICSVGALTNTQVEFPPEARHGVMSAGIGFSTEALLLPLSRTALTLAVVLAAYFWLRYSQSRAESSQAA